MFTHTVSDRSCLLGFVWNRAVGCVLVDVLGCVKQVPWTVYGNGFCWNCWESFLCRMNPAQWVWVVAFRHWGTFWGWKCGFLHRGVSYLLFSDQGQLLFAVHKYSRTEWDVKSEIWMKCASFHEDKGSLMHHYVTKHSDVKSNQLRLIGA